MGKCSYCRLGNCKLINCVDLTDTESGSFVCQRVIRVSTTVEILEISWNFVDAARKIYN